MLPAPADSLWSRTADKLHGILDHLPGERPVFRMGGGTVLAARWGHRKSTDIDLTVPDGTDLNEARRLHEHEIRRTMEDVGARRMVLTEMHFVFELQAGTVEITEADPRPGTGTTRVECGGFPIDGMSTTQIIRGKLERSLKHEPPARDLLDVIVARRVDPAALEGAVNMLSNERQRLIMGRWEEAAYRVDKEAPETLHDVKDEYRRFTRDLCHHAIESFEDSRYVSSGMKREGNDVRIITRTLRRTNTIPTTPAELAAVLDASGMNGYLQSHGPGQAEIERRIETALTDESVEYTPLTGPEPAPERPATRTRKRPMTEATARRRQRDR